jgi:hypothetical protein
METEKTPLKTQRRAKPVMEPGFISPRDAARLTGTTRQSWTNWARQGLFTSVRLNKRVLIPVSEFERLLSEGTRVHRVAGGQ